VAIRAATSVQALDVGRAALATIPGEVRMVMAPRDRRQASRVAVVPVADQVVSVVAAPEAEVSAEAVAVVVEAVAPAAALAARADLVIIVPDNRLAAGIALILAPRAIAGIAVNRVSMAW